MKQNNRLTFSSRCRKHRNWTTKRRRPRYWRWRWCRRCMYRYVSCRWCNVWVGWNSDLTIRSYQHHRNVPLSVAPHHYTPTQIQHSVGKHQITAAVSSQLWTAGNSTSINMCNYIQESVEGVTMIQQPAGVNCWFVGWYNALCELYCNCPI